MLGQKILLNSYRNASRMLRQPSKELREKKFFQFIQKKTEVVTAHEDKRLALYEKKNPINIRSYLIIAIN